MKVIEAIRTLLLGDSTINSLVTTGDTSRIYPSFPEQGAAYPNVALRFLGGESGMCLEGPDGSHSPSLTADVFANDYDECADLAARIHTRLHGFRGPVAGLHIQQIRCSEAVDLTDDDGFAQDPQIFRHQIDMEVEYQE